MEERLLSEDDEELHSAMDDTEQKNYNKEFILAFETCPSLWNPNNRHYSNAKKRNEDLDKLLTMYKNIKPYATRDDVRKKINSLRSNYRKELKKIEISKSSSSGADEVYKPTSVTFHLLQFLAKIDKPKLKKDNSSSEVKIEQDPLVITSLKNESPPMKIRKKTGILTKQNEIRRTCSLSSQPTVSSQKYINPLALVWSDKLNSLNPTQKLFAEKAINDILFEAQLNNLHRHSVQINTFASHSSPASSPSPIAHW